MGECIECRVECESSQRRSARARQRRNNPDAFFAHDNLAHQLHTEARFDAAETHARETLRIQPKRSTVSLDPEARKLRVGLVPVLKPEPPGGRPQSLDEQ